ncbi:hypothetical protein JANAI62_30300 [Jannaschia pagri]|uniref:DUF2975 domain-containing protein n=2 Tax=Jannaschia pagri TaxID=2829797 RepID=A0ABQ4NPS9_9RHOB|nr:DUF2975 domain-containing protein [Jannaschia sp. AI_61]GIT92733.1 hypothetical protein JANAI61_31910 [Jannaschia sp. AI_61]GIT96407.1 hypothetical protein JANAI62_30300 [Jannaschia sp. AI_62]
MRVSRWLRLACTINMLAIPLLFSCAVLSGEFTAHAITDAHPDLRIDTPPGLWAVITYIVIEALLAVVALYVLWQMRALFGGYAQGEVLTVDSARRLLRSGRGLLTLAATGVLAHSVQTVLLSAGNAPGQRQLSITLSDADLGFLLCGGLLLVVGWAMVEAAHVAEENRGFV